MGRSSIAAETNFHELPRRRLQQLAKKHGIPANKTNAAMADALGELYRSGNLPPPSPYRTPRPRRNARKPEPGVPECDETDLDADPSDSQLGSQLATPSTSVCNVSSHVGWMGRGQDVTSTPCSKAMLKEAVDVQEGEEDCTASSAVKRRLEDVKEVEVHGSAVEECGSLNQNASDQDSTGEQTLQQDILKTDGCREEFSASSEDLIVSEEVQVALPTIPEISADPELEGASVEESALKENVANDCHPCDADKDVPGFPVDSVEECQTELVHDVSLHTTALGDVSMDLDLISPTALDLAAKTLEGHDMGVRELEPSKETEGLFDNASVIQECSIAGHERVEEESLPALDLVPCDADVQPIGFSADILAALARLPTVNNCTEGQESSSILPEVFVKDQGEDAHTEKGQQSLVASMGPGDYSETQDNETDDVEQPFDSNRGSQSVETTSDAILESGFDRSKREAVKGLQPSSGTMQRTADGLSLRVVCPETTDSAMDVEISEPPVMFTEAAPEDSDEDGAMDESTELAGSCGGPAVDQKTASLGNGSDVEIGGNKPATDALVVRGVPANDVDAASDVMMTSPDVLRRSALVTDNVMEEATDFHGSGGPPQADQRIELHKAPALEIGESNQLFNQDRVMEEEVDLHGSGSAPLADQSCRLQKALDRETGDSNQLFNDASHHESEFASPPDESDSDEGASSPQAGDHSESPDWPQSVDDDNTPSSPAHEMEIEESPIQVESNFEQAKDTMSSAQPSQTVPQRKNDYKKTPFQHEQPQSLRSLQKAIKQKKALREDLIAKKRSEPAREFGTALRVNGESVIPCSETGSVGVHRTGIVKAVLASSPVPPVAVYRELVDVATTDEPPSAEEQPVENALPVPVAAVSREPVRIVSNKQKAAKHLIKFFGRRQYLERTMEATARKRLEEKEKHLSIAARDFVPITADKENVEGRSAGGKSADKLKKHQEGYKTPITGKSKEKSRITTKKLSQNMRRQVLNEKRGMSVNNAGSPTSSEEVQPPPSAHLETVMQ